MISKLKYSGFFLLLFLGITKGLCQYSFSGYISDSTDTKTVYLSVIEDYRKMSRTYLEQIIRKTETDSTGFFEFKGDNLLTKNRIYKIHIDECSETMSSTHFFTSCENTQSILFIANVNDTVFFPTTFNDEIFCDITSTNSNSALLLEINLLKEEMIFDFSDFRSKANKNLNSKKWFKKFQEYGRSQNEPLAELYIYEFLSDRRNEIYDHYLKDVQENPYYTELYNRLLASYPEARFTQLYKVEIQTDKEITTKSKSHPISWIWILALLLLLSISSNVFQLFKQKKLKHNQLRVELQQLTQQEQKVVSLITQNKTNKEIAAELFISVSTVKTHINNLYRKLNVTTRSDLKHKF